MKTLLTIAGLVSVCFASQAITVLDNILNPANGHTYALLSAASWTDSETYAQSLGGHLVTINNATENQWVADAFYPLIGDNGSLWIGYYNPTQDALGGTHASNFVWANGETPGYTDWYLGQFGGSAEPNNTGGIEFYTTMRPRVFNPYGSWNDYANDNPPVYGVVEVVPEPSTFALAGLAALGIVVLRKKSDQTA